FTAIDLAGSGQLVIEQTGSESLSVTADDNLVSLYTSEVKGGTLYLSRAKDTNVSGMRPLYKVTMAELKGIDISGSADIDASKLEGESLSMSIAGSASAKLVGRIRDFRLSIAGSGSADATGLKATRAKIDVSGSGDVVVNVSDELDASIAG